MTSQGHPEGFKPSQQNSQALPPGWELRVARDYEDGSRVAAEWLAEQHREKPDMLLCAATGNSPRRTYELWARAILEAGKSSNDLRILKLDEWGGLAMDDPATCEDHLQKLLIQPLKIRPENYTRFESNSRSPAEECRRIGAWINEHGPVDVCVLGLGINGHLGFNEPAHELNADCHVAHLTDESLSHAMLSVTSERPHHGLTLGMRDILASRSVLLLVFGTAKSAQFERLITGSISTRFPASFLTLHRRVICICDEMAAALLPEQIRTPDQNLYL